MKIVILDSVSYGDDIDLDGFTELGDVSFYQNSDSTNIKLRIRDADIVVINNVSISNEELFSAGSLKLIAIAATGTDNVDLDYCRKTGILVQNVTEYATESVAQHTFAMLFHLMEQTSYYDSYVKSGKWSDSDSGTHIGKKFRQLSGKRWGIIGMGNIGKRVASLALAFGCEVVYYKREKDKGNEIFEGLSLKDLLRSSAIISIHAPLNNETKNMICKKELDLIKRGSILLNLGRGGIINEDELADTIDKNGIFAGLDVFSNEPLKKTSPLLSLEKPENLVMTPHIGFAAKEAREAVIEGTLRNIRGFINSYNK